MRRFCIAVPLLLAFVLPARAEQPRCPLPLGECMAAYGQMQARPWLGVVIQVDSTTGARLIHEVVPGGPAEQAGVRAGDTLRSIGGAEPQLWFASKAGWKQGWTEAESVAIRVGRAGKPLQLQMPLRHIPEKMLARIIGVHVLEAHLAYTDETHAHDEER